MSVDRAAIAAALGFPPSDEQWAVISCDERPRVVVAGAGSGKTASMAGRVAYIVGQGWARPDEVLGLTFTTKATSELLARIRRALDALPGAEVDEDAAPGGEASILTYHAFAARIVAEHGVRMGLEPGAPLLADGLRHQLAYLCVCASHRDLGRLRASPSEITSRLLRLDDDLTELAVSTDALRAADLRLVTELSALPKRQQIAQTMVETALARMSLADLVDEWRELKRVRGFVDFADQIRLAGVLVDRYPDVVADIRARSRFVLLDEYQDTSIAQRMLLQRLFGDGHSVLAVGDPAQAIYGWRGASVHNIDEFGDHFPTAAGTPADRLALTTNRRSGARILDVANEVATPLRSAHGIDALAADADRGSGAIACALLHTHADEVDWVASRIAEEPAGELDGRRVRWSHIAVLCARKEDVAAVDAALQARGVPTHVVGGAGLLSRPAAVELRAILEVVDSPSANPSFVRIAAGARWRIGARDLAALGDRAAHLAGERRRGEATDVASALDEAVAGSDPVDLVSLTEALDDLGDPSAYSPEAVARFADLAAELRDLRTHAGEPLAAFVQRVLAVTGLGVEVAVGTGPSRVANRDALATLVDLAAQFGGIDGRTHLGGFLAYLRDLERFDVDLEVAGSRPEDAVRLLTVHKAKGLEFPVVYVPFLSAGGWPGRGRSRGPWTRASGVVPWPVRDDVPADLRYPAPGEAPTASSHTAYTEALARHRELDHHRLAYVAFTRARDRLVVSGHWWGPRQATRRGPAPYLAAVRVAVDDDEVLTWIEEPDAENPSRGEAGTPVAWPDAQTAARATAVARVADRVAAVDAHEPMLPGAEGATGPVADQVREWDRLAEALVGEARARANPERVVVLPPVVSASLLMRALADPEGVARDLARPMPRRPMPAARRGIAFHEWVEARYGQQPLLAAQDLQGAADDDLVDDAVLADLAAAFERTEYAARTPVAVERDFAVVVAGRVVNGRIDAVFRDPATGRDEVVDWKTGRTVDPVQLAIYRIAWARIRAVPVADVDAAFVLVGSGTVLRPDTDDLVAGLVG